MNLGDPEGLAVPAPLVIQEITIPRKYFLAQCTKIGIAILNKLTVCVFMNCLFDYLGWYAIKYTTI
jgi:hypothetical protein